MSKANIHALPEPSADALAHSNKVRQFLVESICHQGGLISFQDYMQHALYAAGLGYYVAGASKLGEAGDFVTAPEISPLFSNCLANAVSPVLQELANTQLPAAIYEFGAGRGRMAADIVQHLRAKDVPLTHYYIVEVSPDLIARQREYLEQQVPEFLDNISWLSELPKTINGVVLGNEVLDAMPVCMFKKTATNVTELGVALQTESDDQHDFVLAGLSHENDRLIKRIAELEADLEQAFSDGYVSEVNFMAEDWLAAIAQRLQSGVVLLIDYGYPRHEYYHAQRQTGTLMCHYQHHAHIDPFVYPGIQDITAHIDFTAIANAGVANGLELNGYTTQASFLLDNKLEALLQKQAHDDPQKMLLLSREVQKLIMPHEMGELFKVIGFSRNMQAKIQGFAKDLAHKL